MVLLALLVVILSLVYRETVVHILLQLSLTLGLTQTLQRYLNSEIYRCAKIYRDYETSTITRSWYFVRWFHHEQIDPHSIYCDYLRDNWATPEQLLWFRPVYAEVLVAVAVAFSTIAIVTGTVIYLTFYMMSIGRDKILRPRSVLSPIIESELLTKSFSALTLPKVQIGGENNQCHVCPIIPNSIHPVHFRNCPSYKDAIVIMYHKDVHTLDSIPNKICYIPDSGEPFWQGSKLHNPFVGHELIGKRYSLRLIKSEGGYNIYAPMTVAAKPNHHRLAQVITNSYSMYIARTAEIYYGRVNRSVFEMKSRVVDDIIATMSTASRDGKYLDLLRSYTLGRFKSSGEAVEYLPEKVRIISRLVDLGTTQLPHVASKCNPSTNIITAAISKLRISFDDFGVLRKLREFRPGLPWDFKTVPVPTYEVYTPPENSHELGFNTVKDSRPRFRASTTTDIPGVNNGGESSPSKVLGKRSNVNRKESVKESSKDLPEPDWEGIRREVSERPVSYQPSSPEQSVCGDDTGCARDQFGELYPDRVHLQTVFDAKGIPYTVQIHLGTLSRIIEQLPARDTEFIRKAHANGKLDEIWFDTETAINKGGPTSCLPVAVDKFYRRWREIVDVDAPVIQSNSDVSSEVLDLFKDAEPTKKRKASPIRRVGKKISRKQETRTENGKRDINTETTQ